MNALSIISSLEEIGALLQHMNVFMIISCLLSLSQYRGLIVFSIRTKSSSIVMVPWTRVTHNFFNTKLVVSKASMPLWYNYDLWRLAPTFAGTFLVFVISFVLPFRSFEDGLDVLHATDVLLPGFWAADHIHDHWKGERAALVFAFWVTRDLSAILLDQILTNRESKTNALLVRLLIKILELWESLE